MSDLVPREPLLWLMLLGLCACDLRGGEGERKPLKCLSPSRSVLTLLPLSSHLPDPLTWLLL